MRLMPPEVGLHQRIRQQLRGLFRDVQGAVAALCKGKEFFGGKDIVHGTILSLG